MVWDNMGGGGGQAHGNRGFQRNKRGGGALSHDEEMQPLFLGQTARTIFSPLDSESVPILSKPSSYSLESSTPAGKKRPSGVVLLFGCSLATLLLATILFSHAIYLYTLTKSPNGTWPAASSSGSQNSSSAAGGAAKTADSVGIPEQDLSTSSSDPGAGSVTGSGTSSETAPATVAHEADPFLLPDEEAPAQDSNLPSSGTAEEGTSEKASSSAEEAKAASLEEGTSEEASSSTEKTKAASLDEGTSEGASSSAEKTKGASLDESQQESKAADLPVADKDSEKGPPLDSATDSEPGKEPDSQPLPLAEGLTEVTGPELDKSPAPTASKGADSLSDMPTMPDVSNSSAESESDSGSTGSKPDSSKQAGASRSDAIDEEKEEEKDENEDKSGGTNLGNKSDSNTQETNNVDLNKLLTNETRDNTGSESEEELSGSARSEPKSSSSSSTLKPDENLSEESNQNSKSDSDVDPTSETEEEAPTDESNGIPGSKSKTTPSQDSENTSRGEMEPSPHSKSKDDSEPDEGKASTKGSSFNDESSQSPRVKSKAGSTSDSEQTPLDSEENLESQPEETSEPQPGEKNKSEPDSSTSPESDAEPSSDSEEDRTEENKSEVDKTDEPDVPSHPHPLVIYQFYATRKAWTELKDKPPYRPIGTLSSSVRVPPAPDLNARKLFPILKDKAYRKLLSTYGAIFAVDAMLSKGKIDEDEPSPPPWLGFENWMADLQGIALSKEALGLLEGAVGERKVAGDLAPAVEVNRNVFYYWGSYGPSDLYVECDSIYARCSAVFSLIFEEMFEKESTIGSDALPARLMRNSKMLPGMPGESRGYACCSHWAMTRENVHKFLAFARAFFVTAESIWDVHSDPNNCPLSMGDPKESKANCWSYLLERLVNIWAYHSGLHFQFVESESGAISGQFSKDSRDNALWFEQSQMENFMSTFPGRLSASSLELYVQLGGEKP